MPSAQKNALQVARDRLVRYLDEEERKFWKREADNTDRPNRFVFGRTYPEPARERDLERGCDA